MKVYKNKLLFVIVMCLSIGLSACGKQQTNTVMFSQLQTAMLNADKNLPEMNLVKSGDDNAESAFIYLSGADYDKIDDYFLAYDKAGMAYEITVVVTKEEKDAAAIQEDLQSHVDTRVKLYESYEPNEVERAKNATIVNKGNYTALIMCEDQTAVKKIFEELVK